MNFKTYDITIRFPEPSRLMPDRILWNRELGNRHRPPQREIGAVGLGAALRFLYGLPEGDRVFLFYDRGWGDDPACPGTWEFCPIEGAEGTCYNGQKTLLVVKQSTVWLTGTDDRGLLLRPRGRRGVLRHRGRAVVGLVPVRGEGRAAVLRVAVCVAGAALAAMMSGSFRLSEGEREKTMGFDVEDDELDPPTRVNGEGPWVIKDATDGRYIGREPNGNTPASMCWPTKLNRHVMHFTSEDAAREYVRAGKDPGTKAPRFIRVRPKAQKAVTA